ncbi:MAG: PLP-dependent aminotransferase family protein [Candidatus Acidiferrales bacterium]
MIDFQYNYPLLGTEAAIVSAAVQKHAAQSNAWVSQKALAGTAEHRAVAASFLSQWGAEISANRVFLCSGGHSAVSVALTRASLDGAAVAVDELTYPAFRRTAANRGMKVIACAGDEDGMLPQALADAVTSQNVKAVYLTPTVHNPLGTVMPPSRRLALANVIRQHSLWLIEDDAYRFLEPAGPAPISWLVPERSFYIYSFTKPVALGMKVSYLAVPDTFAEGLDDFVSQVNSGTSLLFADVLTALVHDGTVQRLIAEKQALGRARQELISSGLAGWKIRAHRNGFHSWIELPQGIDAHAFCAACESRGVLLTPGSRYGNGNPEFAGCFRLAVGNERDRDRITEGLAIVKQTLASF